MVVAALLFNFLCGLFLVVLNVFPPAQTSHPDDTDFGTDILIGLSKQYTHNSNRNIYTYARPRPDDPKLLYGAEVKSGCVNTVVVTFYSCCDWFRA